MQSMNQSTVELSVSASQSPSKRKGVNKNGQVDDGPGSTFGGPRKGGKSGNSRAVISDLLSLSLLAEPRSLGPHPCPHPSQNTDYMPLMFQVDWAD